MADRRRKDTNWLLNLNDDGSAQPGQASLAVLMDIRDELKRINQRLDCIETIRIPRYLKRIASNTAKPRKAKS